MTVFSNLSFFRGNFYKNVSVAVQHTVYFTIFTCIWIRTSNAGVCGQLVINPTTSRLDCIGTAVSSSTLPSGSTQYIQNTNTIQTGATAYPDFLNVNTAENFYGPFLSSGTFNFTSTGTVKQLSINNILDISNNSGNSNFTAANNSSISLFSGNGVNDAGMDAGVINLNGGNAGNRTTSNGLAGTGGSFNLTGQFGGQSLFVGSGANTGGTGGFVQIIAADGSLCSGSTLSNTGGAGGKVKIQAGNGGPASGTSPQGGNAGIISLTTQTGGSTTGGGTPGNGGDINITAGPGGVVTDVNGTGGNGGNFNHTGGAGADIINSGSSSNGGGNGSNFYVFLGTGGAARNSTLSNVGGSGGGFTITTGPGGGATVGTSRTGGSAGNMNITLGNGGNAGTGVGNNGGGGGSLFILPGSKGTGGTANSAGNIYLNTNSVGTVRGSTLIGDFSTMTVNARLQVMSTTEQQRWKFDSPDYVSLVVGSGGVGTFLSSGTNSGFSFSSKIAVNQAIPTFDVDVAGIVNSTGMYTSGVQVGLNFSTYAASGVYNFTTTTSTIAVGTSSSTITLTSPGTYRLDALVNLRYNGATFASNQFVTMNLYRQNNTPGVIGNSQTQEELQVLATPFTSQFGQYDIPTTFYTTTNSNDVISLTGVITATPSAGNFQATEASLVAQRLY